MRLTMRSYIKKKGITGGHVILLNKKEFRILSGNKAAGAAGTFYVSGRTAGWRRYRRGKCLRISDGRCKPCDRDIVCVPGWPCILWKSRKTGNDCWKTAADHGLKLPETKREILYCNGPLAKVYRGRSNGTAPASSDGILWWISDPRGRCRRKSIRYRDRTGGITWRKWKISLLHMRRRRKLCGSGIARKRLGTIMWMWRSEAHWICLAETWNLKTYWKCAEGKEKDNKQRK